MYISSFMIFAYDLLIAVYSILSLDYGNDVRQEANSSSKWVLKQWRQLAISTVPLAQELLTNMHCSGGSRSFAKETRALKMRSSGWPLEVDSDQLRGSWKVNKLDKWVPRADCKSKKLTF